MHQHLNDLVTRALVSAGVPATKEPVGLIRRDGKRPDGMTQIPWRSGKLLVWERREGYPFSEILNTPVAMIPEFLPLDKHSWLRSH